MSHEIATYDPEMTKQTFRSVCPRINSRGTGAYKRGNLRRQHRGLPIWTVFVKNRSSNFVEQKETKGAVINTKHTAT